MFIVDVASANLRLDKALANFTTQSRSRIRQLIEKSYVLLNDVICTDPSYKVKIGDNLVLLHSFETIHDYKPVAKNISLDILYEDDQLIVLNKDHNMSVHPNYSSNHDNISDDTLVNALLYHTKDLSYNSGDVFRPGIVHRLDKDTTGLMVVAKTDQAYLSLSEQIRDRSLVRKYKALIWGIMTNMSGTIEGNIARKKNDRTRMEVSKNGKYSVTHYNSIEVFAGGLFSLIECVLDTGRMHQIRVHLSNAGHSIVGDQKYGHNARKIKKIDNNNIKELLYGFNRQALHSYYIEFFHPISGECLSFSRDIFGEFANIIDSLRAIRYV